MQSGYDPLLASSYSENKIDSYLNKDFANRTTTSGFVSKNKFKF